MGLQGCVCVSKHLSIQAIYLCVYVHMSVRVSSGTGVPTHHQLLVPLSSTVACATNGCRVCASLKGTKMRLCYSTTSWQTAAILQTEPVRRWPRYRDSSPRGLHGTVLPSSSFVQLAPIVVGISIRKVSMHLQSTDETVWLCYYQRETQLSICSLRGKKESV